MKGPDTISRVLESEHQSVDERFERFQRHLAEGEIGETPFEEAAQVLHRHIYLEEEILFPEVEARGLTGPTAVMAQEHGEICRLLDRIRDLIGTGAVPESVQSALTTLRSRLEGHNLKEEQVLYPTADALVGRDQIAQVLPRICEAKAPEGWSCRAHRN